MEKCYYTGRMYDLKKFGYKRAYVAGRKGNPSWFKEIHKQPFDPKRAFYEVEIRSDNKEIIVRRYREMSQYNLGYYHETMLKKVKKELIDDLIQAGLIKKEE